MDKQTKEPSRNYFEWKDAGYPLFEILKAKPNWWIELTTKYPDDIYINIRKNGHLNVYTQGGSLMELSCPDGGNIVAKIHKYYLSEKFSKGQEYRTDLSPETIVSRLGEIFDKIHSDTKFNGSKDSSQEGCAEKYIQSQMYIHRISGRFLDTEFAEMRLLTDEEFQTRKEKREKQGKALDRLSHYKQVRIDLVELLDDGRIQFVELKRISDARLRSSKGTPHIKKQMEEYHNLVNRYTDEEIVNYYSHVLETLREIGVCPKDLLDAKVTGVSRTVRLYFFNYKDELKGQGGKEKRIRKIGEFLEEEHILSNINQIHEDYCS